MPSRHSEFRTTVGQEMKPSSVLFVVRYSGFKMIVVSIISTGAGSVAVSARPSLPATERTSGTWLITLSCHDMMRFTSVSDVLGSSTGMKSREPSLSGGMNSLPMPRNAPVASFGLHDSIFASSERGRPNASSRALASNSPAKSITVLRQRSAQSSSGS